MNMTSYSITFSSELCRVKEVVSDILNFFSSNLRFKNNDDLYDLKLIFSELLINAVIHGNRQDQTKKVTLHIDIENQGEILATIADEGTGFDYRRLLTSSGGQSCHQEGLFDENGRGICLVSSLTDQISFQNNGSVIHFLKRVTIDG